MAEWVKQQAEREAEKEQKRLERLQRKLAEPRHCFTNPSYLQQCHEMAERLEDSVLKGENRGSLVWPAGTPEAGCSRPVCTARREQFFSFFASPTPENLLKAVTLSPHCRAQDVSQPREKGAQTPTALGILATRTPWTPVKNTGCFMGMG